MANLVLGVSGSVAAWKACDLASQLVQAGHRVDVVLTRGAERFVRPLGFAALTHRRVHTDDTWGTDATPHDHLVLVRDADLLVVAPCTANLLGKLAHGIADEVLSATCLAAACPRLLAPAMNHRMWRNPRVQANVALLAGDGVHFVGPEEGWLSEAEVGPGRMSEPETVAARVRDLLRAAR